MSLSTTKNLHSLNIKTIQDAIIKTKKEIIELNIKKATKQNIKSHILKLKQHELAQLLTIETIKLKQKNVN
uniref:Ribosomal protein L29 n=1 Tax=Callithamnion tetricum TaxID=193179 RepID=A0A4D6WU28_9FLOR|nr:ribosomal protein L29 [Callithamnion tetricum]